MGTTINISTGTKDYEFYNVPEKVGKAIITLLYECENDDSEMRDLPISVWQGVIKDGNDD